MVAGVPPEGISPLADIGDAYMGTSPHSRNRLSAISYYADPTKKKEGPKSMDEVDPELIKTFNKLGIPLEEQMALSGMAVDAVMDSVSVKTTFKETLMEKGINLLLVQRGCTRASRLGTEISRFGGALS